MGPADGALHAIDPRVVPDGRWTDWFRRRLAAIRSRLGLSEAVRVDATLWNHPDVQARFWADPWAEGGPTEADLTERIVGMATPRPGTVTARAVSPASAALPDGSCWVDVCVHRRGLTPALRAQVAVLVLRRRLPDDATQWAGLQLPALPGLDAAMAGVGPAGGPLPASMTVAAPWSLADTATPVRRPGRPARTADPAVVTFDVDFTGLSGIWLLVALVHHGAGTPHLGGAADLRDLVRRSPHVAARTVHLV